MIADFWKFAHGPTVWPAFWGEFIALDCWRNLMLTSIFPAVFPGLVESIDDGDEARFKKWADIIEGILLDAAKSL